MPQGHRVQAEAALLAEVVVEEYLFNLLLGAGCGRGHFSSCCGWQTWGVQAGVTLGADHLVTAVLLGQLADRGLDGGTPLTKHQV